MIPANTAAPAQVQDSAGASITLDSQAVSRQVHEFGPGEQRFVGSQVNRDRFAGDYVALSDPGPV